MSTEATEFLKLGGDAQLRYESLRSRWLAPESPGAFAILGLPWGRRVLHFGFLGLMDEDPTGRGWFTTVAQTPASIPPAAPAARCRRMMLAAPDGESRLRDAYRWILLPAKHQNAVTEG